MNKHIAFHNDPKVQKKYIARVQAHYDADEIAHGFYWEKGKGCAVGCTVENNDSAHQAMEDELGVPRQLAYLEDRVFEGMYGINSPYNLDSKEFPLRFIKTMKLGADLSKIVPQFMIWLLADKTDGVIKYARPDGVKAIKLVVSLYKRKLKGGDVSSDEWIKAREKALDARRAASASAYAAYAASDAAYAAADAAYAASAYAAADAADAAYADAAYAASAAAYAYAAYAAAYAARKAHYKKMADKIIELLKAAK